MLLLLVPAAALMLVLSEPITRIVYQRGEFDAAQTDIVAEALFFFSLSLPFAGVNLILIRTFFSLQLPWRPTQIALANLGVNAGLDALLYKPMGVGGITLATAIVSLVTTVAARDRAAGADRRSRHGAHRPRGHPHLRRRRALRGGRARGAGGARRPRRRPAGADRAGDRCLGRRLGRVRGRGDGHPRGGGAPDHGPRSRASSRGSDRRAEPSYS